MALHDSPQEWMLSTCVLSLIFAFMLAKLVSLIISFRRDNLRIVRDPGGGEEVDDLLVHENVPASSFLPEAAQPVGSVYRENLGRDDLDRHSEEDLHGNAAAASRTETWDNSAESSGLSSEIFTERQGKIAEESFLSDEEDWEGIEGTELERTFGKAASFLEKLVLDPTSNISNDLKLQFYGLYKQATEGPCASPQPPAYRPAARAKWNSWKHLGQISREEGMQRYIALISKLSPDWDKTSKSKDGMERSDAQSFPKNEKTTGMGPVFSTLTQAKEDIENEGLEDLHIFAKEGNLKGVDGLLDTGVPVDEKDSDGRTALHWAADQGHLDVVKLLISRGAQINLKDSEGQTPLHYAVTCEWEDIASLLLDKGADPSLVDNDGCTAYETSAEG